ncbi:MAG: TIM barrel protein [Spirochaeta sp.]|nr:TIM barrel protein [Spirochaeta sp.]
MKLGFVSAIFAEFDFAEVINFAAKEQFSCVELMCWPKGKAERRYAGVTHIDVGELTAEKTAEIQKTLEEKSIFISGLGYYPNPLEADEEQSGFFVEHLKQVITAAQQLGVPVVNTFVGRDHTRNIEDNWKKFKAVWPPIVKHAENSGVKIGIENCPMYFTGDEWPGGKNFAYSPAIWRRMFAEIPSKYFGLNYDPSHLVWQQMDHIKPIYEFKDRIYHVHIKDAKIDYDRLNDVGIMATPLEYHLPKLPGLGDVNWGKFFSALTDIGYRGPVCIEVEDRAYEDSLHSRKTALIQSRDYIKQFVVL